MTAPDEALRAYVERHPTRRVLLTPDEIRALLDELDALRAQVERVESLRDDLAAMAADKRHPENRHVAASLILIRLRAALDPQ